MGSTNHVVLALFVAASALGGCVGGEGVYRGVYEGARAMECERAAERGERPAEWNPGYDEYERYRKGEAPPAGGKGVGDDSSPQGR